MSQTDPDPYDPDARSRSELAGVPEPDDGDPTLGGKRGQIGEAPSIVSDQPDDGSAYPIGGDSVVRQSNDPPVADPGPDA
jgi:hypothetical protein